MLRIRRESKKMMQLPNGSVSHGDRRRKKSKTGEDGSPTQLRLALEAEDERRNME